MKKWRAFISRLFSSFRFDEQDEVNQFLAQSADIAELEQRMRQVERG